MHFHYHILTLEASSIGCTHKKVSKRFADFPYKTAFLKSKFNPILHGGGAIMARMTENSLAFLQG